MSDRKRLHPEAWAYSKDASFAQGVEVNGTVYVAGMVALNDDGQLVGAGGDMDAQARQTLKNVEKVLAEAGMTLDNVVKMTCYITMCLSMVSTLMYAQICSRVNCQPARR
jgi:enamine deaminase RidA (YjgF/YER057c/UK114 family)